MYTAASVRARLNKQSTKLKHLKNVKFLCTPAQMISRGTFDLCTAHRLTNKAANNAPYACIVLQCKTCTLIKFTVIQI